MEQAGPTAFEWITFGIAVAGLLLALGSLLWQMWSWAWTGSRVRVEMGYGIAEIPADGGPVWVDLIEVTARNRGRTAIDVTAWYLEFKKGEGFFFTDMESWQGPVPPVRLEPGQSEHWRIGVPMVRDALIVAGVPLDTPLHGQVQLGTGKRERSRKAIALTADGQRPTSN